MFQKVFKYLWLLLKFTQKISWIFCYWKSFRRITNCLSLLWFDGGSCVSFPKNVFNLGDFVHWQKWKRQKHIVEFFWFSKTLSSILNIFSSEWQSSCKAARTAKKHTKIRVLNCKTENPAEMFLKNDKRQLGKVSSIDWIPKKEIV